MAKNLKKFVNQKFTRTVDLGLLKWLLERHAGSLQGLELDVFETDPEQARTDIQEFLMGPEDAYPDGLVADLHRIAELGNSNGLRVIQEQAARYGVSIKPEIGGDGSERRQDPKHIALKMFLEEPRVFDAASDMQALMARSSLAEFAGLEEGVEASTDEMTKAEFEREAEVLFEADLLGRYCRVGWYDDADEVNLVITHGSTITTTPVVENGTERVISFRVAENAVLSYSAMAGRLKIGGVPKARRADLAEIFATIMLGRPGFFAGEDAQHLYTLAPVERAGYGFTIQHAFDPGIRRVQIVEVQADRVGTDPQSGFTRTFWSHLVRDSRDNALARLGESTRGIAFGSDWHLNHLVLRVHFDTEESRPARVTVKLKPPGTASFKRHRFEDRIMPLLRRNGLVHDRDPGQAAAAAE